MCRVTHKRSLKYTDYEPTRCLPNRAFKKGKQLSFTGMRHTHPPITYPYQDGDLPWGQGLSNHGTGVLYWDYAQVAWLLCSCDTCAASGGPWTICEGVLLPFHSDDVLASSCVQLPIFPAASALIQTAWHDGQPDSPSSVDVARQVTQQCNSVHKHAHTHSLKFTTFNLSHMVGNTCSQVHILCL